MRHIPIATFKDKVSEFISAVEAGEEIVITRHGKAAARILPPKNDEELRLQRQDAWDRLAQHRAKMRAEGRTTTIDEMIAWKNEGRR